MKRKPLRKKIIPQNVPSLKKRVLRSETKLDDTLYFLATILIRVLVFVGVFFLGMIVTLIAVGTVIGFMYLHTVSTHAGISAAQLIRVAQQSRSLQPIQTDGRKNILILGLDSLTNRDRDSILTDTIMVVSANLANGKIHTFSFPRDLYIASHSAKINSLYSLGKTQNTPLIENTVEAITGLPIHHVISLDIATVGKLIDAVGGLDVEVERSFVDYKFPRTDVDVRSEKNEKNLYEVVAFTKGVEHMSGDRALRYVRSRHSLDPLEGTDDARVKRQQRVITALIAKLKDPSIIRRPEDIGKLIRLYAQYFEETISMPEAGSVGYTLLSAKRTPVLVTHQFTVQIGSGPGDIYHPERFESGAWVYLPVDPTYAQMRSTIRTWLNE